MKLIIEIPEAKLKALQVGEKNGVGIGTLERAVLDGIPIPENDFEAVFGKSVSEFKSKT